jgi:hypothetical protein
LAGFERQLSGLQAVISVSSFNGAALRLLPFKLAPMVRCGKGARLRVAFSASALIGLACARAPPDR